MACRRAIRPGLSAWQQQLSSARINKEGESPQETVKFPTGLLLLTEPSHRPATLDRGLVL